MPSLMDEKEPKKCKNNVPKSDIQKYQTNRSNVEIKKDMFDVKMRIHALTRMLSTVGDATKKYEELNGELKNLKKEFTANRIYN